MFWGGTFVGCVSLALLMLDPRAFAQANEWDLDAESGAERSAEAERLDRLLRVPFDLRLASEDDLLQIPGVRRGEASAIIRAVRHGSILELRAIDLIPGVRRGTADRIAPYVVLTGPNGFTKRDARIRSIATLRNEDGGVVMIRRRYDIRIDGPPGANAEAPLRLEVRRSGVEEAAWFSYARMPGPFSGWTMAFGDLDVRSGSALLDGGRRTSLIRPSDWERRLLPDVRILPGYDAGTAGRGAALQVASGERVVQASLSTGMQDRRRGTISWAEHWPFRVTTHIVRRVEPAGSSIRVEHEGQSGSVSLEAAMVEQAASYVASWRWQREGSLWIHSIVRLVRRITASGVPRVGSRAMDEAGASLALDHVVNRRFRWHLAGDIARVREIVRTPSIAWPSVTLGIGGEVGLGHRTRAIVEWERSERNRERVRRWSLHLTHPLSAHVYSALALAHRSEFSPFHVSTAGVLAMTTLSWTHPTSSAHVRWTSGEGDPSVEFWSLGPGPQALGGLQRYAGRSGEVRATFQWLPTRSIELGIAAALKYRPSKELQTSILLEIQL
jgi:hypothetical protein